MNLSRALWVLVSLAVLWAVIFGVVRVVGARRVTPKKIEAYIEANPIRNAGGKERIDDANEAARRKKVIDEVTGRMRKMEYEERRVVRWNSPVFKGFYELLADTEKIEFVEDAIESMYREMIETFNRMDPEMRRKILNSAIRDLKEGGSWERDYAEVEELDPDLVDLIVSKGLEAYYREASAESKIAIAPFLERLNHNMRQW